MLPSQKRIGFTIFEVIVVIVILAMVLAILIPAVQKVREAAARTQLYNNLKQITLAIHNIHDAYKKFPPAAGTLGDLKDQTISVHLLPYIEQLPLYNQIMQDKKVPTNLKINTYSSPLDFSTPDWIRVQNLSANVRVFTEGGVDTAWNKTVALKTFMPCDTTLFRTFTDGTSNTVAFATRYASAKTVSMDGKSSTPCGYYDLPLANDGGSFFGATPMAGKFSATSTAGWQLMPTLAEVNCASAVGMAHAFGMGGLQISLADGSVRTISPAVSAQTWNQALQPNDGNPPGSDW